MITEEISARVAQDRACRNARANSDKQSARLEHDKALDRVVQAMLADHTQIYQQLSDNESFRGWVTAKVFDLTYDPPPAVLPPKGAPRPGESKSCRWHNRGMAKPRGKRTSPAAPGCVQSRIGERPAPVNRKRPRVTGPLIGSGGKRGPRYPTDENPHDLVFS